MRGLLLFVVLAFSALALEPIPDKTVVLTFDDSPKSHHAFVGPLLKELGFGATFFVSARWMDDTKNFMTWDEIAALHAMGFEIGNHSWSHLDFGDPANAARLAGQLALVENELKRTWACRSRRRSRGAGIRFGPGGARGAGGKRLYLRAAGHAAGDPVWAGAAGAAVCAGRLPPIAAADSG
jgi:peptidoglycan/xylan/chitin deacetylase (PgdA/CDA1 family)